MERTLERRDCGCEIVYRLENKCAWDVSSSSQGTLHIKYCSLHNTASNLLAACKGLVDWARVAEEKIDSEWGERRTFDQMIEDNSVAVAILQAIRVIAKAEGRQTNGIENDH